jgi:hypothetical protein
MGLTPVVQIAMAPHVAYAGSAARKRPESGVRKVSRHRIRWHTTNFVDRRSLLQFIRHLTAISTLLLTALLTLVLLFYSLSVALGAEGSNRVVERKPTAAPARCADLGLRPGAGHSSNDRGVSVCHFKTSGFHDSPE